MMNMALSTVQYRWRGRKKAVPVIGIIAIKAVGDQRTA
jgi:hypothetical protein